MKNFNTLMLAIELHKECKKLETPHYLKDQVLRAKAEKLLRIKNGFLILPLEVLEKLKHVYC